MRPRRAFFIFLFLSLSLLLQGTASSFLAAPREDASKLLSQIGRENNPVKRAKLEVKLARQRLSESIDDYTNGHYNEFWKKLADYADNMQKAWTDLQSSGRIAAKKSDGFKQLDIGLRESRRELEDFEMRITFDERQEVKKVQSKMEDIHNQVLNALFPQPPAKKRPESSTSSPGKKNRRNGSI